MIKVSLQNTPGMEEVKCPSEPAVDEVDLESLVDKLTVQSVLEIKDRTYRFIKYKRCFVASEAIDYMVNEGLAKSREHAVSLGVALQTKRKFWNHVVDDHIFSDTYLFFRLTRDDEQKELVSSAVNNMFDQSTLDVLAIKLLEGLEIKERTFRFRKYKKCFVASEAVDYMVTKGLAKSRGEAVLMGVALQKELKFWHHVVDNHRFADEYLFFRLCRDDDEMTATSRSSGRSSDLDDFSSTRSVSPERSSSIEGSNISLKLSPHKSQKRICLKGFSCHEREKGILRLALLKARSRSQIVFVRGPSGCGKSTLVHSAFASEIQSSGFCFAATKFEQRSNEMTPFAAIRDLLSNVVSQADNSERRGILKSLGEKLGNNSPHLCEALRRLLPPDLPFF